jgi:hypothetical protein
VQRDPRKRRVKLVQKHLIQTDFDIGDSEEDSDFDIRQHQGKIIAQDFQINEIYKML